MGGHVAGSLRTRMARRYLLGGGKEEANTSCKDSFISEWKLRGLVLCRVDLVDEIRGEEG